MPRSRFFRASALATFVAALSAPTSATAQEAAPALRTVTLDDCVSTALSRNVDVLSSGEDVTVAEARRTGVRGELLPKLHVDGTFQEWNQAYVIDGLPVHDVTVWNVTASLTQPVTGLFAIYDAFKVRELGVDIAAVRRDVSRRDTALRVVEGYYRLLQAERLSEVALASVNQLTTQLKQATSFHTNGIVSLDDVLRAKLAVATAQQRLIQARARVTVGRARLAVVMGLPPDSPIEAQPLADDRTPPRDAMSLEQAETAAVASRVELSEVDKRIEQSEHDGRIAQLKLAPQVSVVGAYIHNEGSLLSQTNSAYVGGVASWDVWDWGTTTSGITEAKARGHQARLARTQLADQIRLEVREAFVGVGAADEAVEVARASVASAEENFRLVRKRYDANTATSFDVVDAEGVLTEARGQMQTALYELLVSEASLRRAMGARADGIAHRLPGNPG